MSAFGLSSPFIFHINTYLVGFIAAILLFVFLISGEPLAASGGPKHRNSASTVGEPGPRVGCKHVSSGLILGYLMGFLNIPGIRFAFV